MYEKLNSVDNRLNEMTKLISLQDNLDDKIMVSLIKELNTLKQDLKLLLSEKNNNKRISV